MLRLSYVLHLHLLHISQYNNFVLNGHIYFKVIKRRNNLLHLLTYFPFWCSLLISEDLNFYLISFSFNLMNFIYNKLVLFLSQNVISLYSAVIISNEKSTIIYINGLPYMIYHFSLFLAFSIYIFFSKMTWYALVWFSFY